MRATVHAVMLGWVVWFRLAARGGGVEEIRGALQAYVDNGTVAGAVGMAWTEGAEPRVAAVGLADIASRRPMRENDLFWIASMTKPITALAVVMLEEEGKLSIDDPVRRHLPEFRETWVVEERTEQTLRLRKTRPLTLRDLLTHTSGLQGEPSLGDRTPTLAELALFSSQQPVEFEPGSRWAYSNPSINILGRVVEVVARKPFAEFLQERLFTPLGMVDTTFWPDEERAARLATSYKPDAQGALQPVDLYFLKGPLGDRNRPPRPAGGLFSTARDMGVLYRMLLAGGEWEGRRYIRRERLAAMTTTQTGDIKTGFTEGMSWGLGFQVVKQPQGVTAMFSPGTFGHGGAYGTQSWADPKARTVYILMIQRAGFPNGDDSPVRKAFQEAAAR